MFNGLSNSHSTWSFEKAGFMKAMGDIGVRLQLPFPGQERFTTGGAFNWVLESCSDADWSSNKSHRRSTSCGMYFLNSMFMYGSSRSQKVVSLSSCESELHAMVSRLCDGMFVKACAEFILNEEVEHVQYTDSSSARQVASRQGCGRVRHLSGKLLWIQEKTQDGAVSLRQVGTAENVADIATKCLTRQRLLYLMHETGLVFIPSFENVGQEESARHTAKVGTAAQLKRISKAIFRMSLAMGLEALGPVGTMALPGVCTMASPGVCPDDKDEPNDKINALWTLAGVLLFTCAMTVIFLVSAKLWRRLQERLQSMEIQMNSVGTELTSAQEQLADHYDFAAQLEKGWKDLKKHKKL